MSQPLLTIGALARRAQVSTSLLRYYEKAGLLEPEQRSRSGYRLYAPAAEQTLRFIRSAQRLGFSLNDIRTLLADGAAPAGEAVRDLAEQRFLDIERRITEMLVLRHELELFLDDLAGQIDRAAGQSAGRHYRALLEQVCGHDADHRTPAPLPRLLERLGCRLAAPEMESILAPLRGQHVHLWRDDDGYSILLARGDPSIGAALEGLAASEAACDVHHRPEVTPSEGGFVFRATGPNAFLFAQLFLALEATDP